MKLTNLNEKNKKPNQCFWNEIVLTAIYLCMCVYETVIALKSMGKF